LVTLTTATAAATDRGDVDVDVDCVSTDCYGFFSFSSLFIFKLIHSRLSRLPFSTLIYSVIDGIIASSSEKSAQNAGRWP